MLTKTIIALSLFTGTVACTNYSQASEPDVTNPVHSQTVAQLPTTDVENIAREITVRVNVGEDRGSGILIAKNNDTYTVITNAHVTDRGDTYSIQTNDGIEHEATLVTSTEQNDLAVLEFNSSNTYQVATVGNSDSISEGETVIAAGFPDGEEKLLVTEGAISLITEKPLNKGYAIGFTNETVQGMSGGALLNSNGEVVAILGKGKDAILNTAYDYMDGTKPTASEIAAFREVSFSIPIANIANLSPQLAALVPDESNPDIAQQPETESTPAPKPEYTGIVKTVDDIAEQITVRIAKPQSDSHGSGVIIARNSNTYYVATAAHVVRDKEQYQIVTPDGETYELNNQTIKESSAYDFALFSFTSDKDYTVATVGNYTVAANRDQTVFISGFPGMYAPTRIITGGKVREQDKTSFATKDSSTFVSTTADKPGLLYSNISYGGMSGGAVLDSEGRLVGIHAGAENEIYEENYQEFSLGFSLGIPLKDVITFLDRETSLETEWLQTTTATAAEINQNDYYSIEAQLLTTELPKDKTDLVAWMNYGNQLWRYEKYEEAVSAFERAVAINPSYDRAYYAMGLALFYKGDLRQAATALEKATQINPSPYFYWRYLGNSYLELEQYAEAISAYEEAIAKSPKDFVLYVEHGDVLRYSKKYREAIASYREAIKINPQHPWIYINRGLTYNYLEQYQQALSDYDRSLQINPNLAEAYLNRGAVYNELEQYRRAIGDFTQAIGIEPNLALAYYNRGLTYDKLEQYQQALSDYDRSLQINPNYAEAYINRGAVYNELEQYRRALGDYDRAIEINPNDADAYLNRGLTYIILEQYQQALGDYDRAIEINQNDADAYLNRGNTYNYLGQYQQALGDYDRAIEINPQYADAYNNRGLIYKNLQQYEQAIADYNQVLQIDPNDAGAYLNRGLTYIILEQYQQALSDFTQAIGIDPNSAEAYGSLGFVYIRLNNIEEARTNLEKAQQLFIAQNNTAGAETIASLLEQLP